MVETMPQTPEVEEFLKSIGPFYEIAYSDEELLMDGFTQNELDAIEDETANQSSQVKSRDSATCVEVDVTVEGLYGEVVCVPKRCYEY